MGRAHTHCTPTCVNSSQHPCQALRALCQAAAALGPSNGVSVSQSVSVSLLSPDCAMAAALVSVVHALCFF